MRPRHHSSRVRTAPTEHKSNRIGSQWDTTGPLFKNDYSTGEFIHRVPNVVQVVLILSQIVNAECFFLV